MNPTDIHLRYVNALRTQKKSDLSSASALPCPYSGHHERIFQGIEQLYIHAKAEHGDQINKLPPRQARAQLKEKALEIRKLDQSSDATAGDRSTPDITSLTIDSNNDLPQSSPQLSKKRPAESEHAGRRGKAQSYVDVTDSSGKPIQTSRITSDRIRSKHHDARLYDPKRDSKLTSSSHLPSPEPSSEWSNEPIKTNHYHPSPSPSSLGQTAAQNNVKSQRQPAIPELLKYDPRYPDLLLQPDSKPISQEQLASEVKSIYAGLTMVETKCIHVDRNQAAQSNPETKLAPDHWQALIALHRTLLHEHHDFFLASQHPSSSPALRRLAAKYSMPARMWKHGIHSFLELLRRRLPESIDYMLAFIYLAYQMMALLYETVPAFEDTWIECLGDLGRYRMAIEDEDLRDRETWAGVARSWYTKAADKNPTVGRLYHHLAILARPNALQQLYYYCRSLTCARPFASARESIMTVLETGLGRAAMSYSQASPIDTSFIKSHAILFEELPQNDFAPAKQEFLNQLDNHIGRVTAKWKEQGVYVAVTNIAAWFQYGVDSNILRQTLLTKLVESARNDSSSISDNNHNTTAPSDQQDTVQPSMPRSLLEGEIEKLKDRPVFANSCSLTYETFSIVLRRIGDKNVLPHVHIMLAFVYVFASNPYVSNFIDDTPWTELTAFLNTLIKTENQLQTQSPGQAPADINETLSADIFPVVSERVDELPLPEDYLVRGLVWTQDYLPAKWFEREHDEEERYLEHASTVKARIERVLRLGFQIAQHKRWITYDSSSHTFSIVQAHIPVED